MTYDWTDYFKISKEIIDTCSKKSLSRARKETLFRIAISRAYYAAFHKCKDYIKTYGVRLDMNGIHRDLINNIDIYIQSSEAKVAVNLERAFSLRKQADYNDVFNGLDKEAAAMIVRVKKIIDAISVRNVGPYKV